MHRSQLIIGLGVAILSWYGMMAMHEAGHCLGALATGGRIVTVEIPLTGFSRTDFADSRHPLWVVWAGPVVGAVAPLLLLALLGRVGRRFGQALRFFAGFCLLANGVYFGVGAFAHAGDCGDLLRYGAPLWLLVAFGLTSFVSGMVVWHRLGPVRDWFAAGEGGSHCQGRRP